MKPALLIIFILAAALTGCADYQKTVEGRSVAVSGQTDGANAGGKIVYSVHYR